MFDYKKIALYDRKCAWLMVSSFQEILGLVANRMQCLINFKENAKFMRLPIVIATYWLDL